MKKRAFMFGYGKQGKVIAEALQSDRFLLTLIESDETRYSSALEDGYLDVQLLDVTKDETLEDLVVQQEDYFICVMDDIHLNVYLTLSLHAIYPEASIIAVSDSMHTTEKLYMAGATKVIDLYRVTANRIHNLLRKPIATKLLDDFILNTHNIVFKEIEVPPDSFLDGMLADDVNFSEYEVLLIGLIDKELSHRFVFIASGIPHKLDSGDMLVCVGNDDDLIRFENEIKRKKL